MEPGSVALWAVVVLAVGAVAGAGRHWAGRMLIGSALAATVAIADLGQAFLAEDWRFTYVVDHARSGVGPLLRLAGVWAGPEGSLLFWTAMAAWAAVVAARVVASPVTTGPAVAWVHRLGGGLVAGYGLLVAAVASPFGRMPVPAVDGLGLQPVLEYPAMLWHPPLLYAGLLGLLVPSLVTGARAAAGVDAGVERVLVALPLALLTAGLCTGALWANVELGWGGYWAWDPIESAGLVAWCCAAAALHGSSAGSRSGAGSRSRVIPSGWLVAAVGLAPGLAAVWATTLTRVGLVASVHTFADRPALRVGLLTVAGIVTAGSALLVVVAARRPSGDPAPDTDVEGARAVGRRHGLAVLTAAGFVVAVGAYQPLVEAATTGDRVAIAGHYYSRLLWPLTLVGVALVVAADHRRARGGRRGLAVAAGPVIGAVVGVAAFPLGGPVYGAILSGAGGAVVGSTLASRLRPLGPGTLAHAGFGLFLIGVAGTTAGTVDLIEAPGGRVAAVGDLNVEHRTLEMVEGEATLAAVATVLVNGAEFQPRLVRYTLRGVGSSEVAWRFDGFDEIQVLLVDGDAAGARYQVNRLPRVGLVWLGAAVATLGLASAGFRRRQGHGRVLHGSSVPSGR